FTRQRAGARLSGDLVDVGILSHLRRDANTRDDVAHGLVGVVAEAVRAVGTNTEVDDLPFGQQTLTVRRAQGRPAPEHDQQLLGAVVKVVGGGIPGSELVDAGPELWPRLDQALRLRPAAGPVVRGVPLVSEHVGGGA